MSGTDVRFVEVAPPPATPPDEPRRWPWTRRDKSADSTSFGEILARNTFTWLNLILGVLGAATLSTGALADTTFLIVAVLNTAIGTIQEVRAKRTLDNLRVLNEPRARVQREGAVLEVHVDDLVVGDVVELRVGDQVAADAVVLSGQAELDESVVTGESDPTHKDPGDPLVSGTWLVGGALTAEVTAVGADSYANRLLAEASRFSLSGSELVGSVNRLLRVTLVVLVLIAPLLVWRQLQVEPWRPAVQGAVAGLTGMVPEGLVLLTTLAFFAAAVRLGQRRVLVQELPAVETLARVDELCTDKTGTVTQGRITWGGLILPPSPPAGTAPAGTALAGTAPAGTAPAGAALAGTALPGEEELEAGLAALGAAQAANATMSAIAEGLSNKPGWEAPGWQAEHSVEFNSSRKWSGATFAGHGTWVLGAPEMVRAEDPGGIGPVATRLASAGSRVLVVATGEGPIEGDTLPGSLRLVAAVELREQIRPDARATLAYFEAQGVNVRVVSGDSANTVGAIASEVGLPGADRPVDAREWPEVEAEVDEWVSGHSVFGRVRPEQKRDMVDSLHRRGHVVAMTGDGVNDTLALKEADLGIAMGSGSAVARGVAQLVLLDDQFEVLPFVVAQGRQVLHNIERAAMLFLVKNVYSFIVSVAVAIAGWPYPFLPRQLTLVSTFGIGLPGFFLALGPNEERFRAGFLGRVLRFAVPTAVIISAAILVTFALARQEHHPPDQARTAAVIVTIIAQMWVLCRASHPWRPWKIGLVVAMAVGFAAVFVIPGVDTFLNLEHRPPIPVIGQTVLIGAAACVVLAVASRFVARLEERREAAREALATGTPPGARSN